MNLNHCLTRIGKLLVVFTIALSFLLGTAVPPGMAEDLPLRDPEFHGTINETYRNSEADEHLLDLPAQPPEGAPNVVLIMLDDVGFGAAETFGGPVHTPTLERLAKNGLSYNRFHTTAMCSPTRAALLTGRNHHSVSSGIVTNFATGFPGYSGRIPQSTATVAKILQSNGYNTAWIGKNHNLPLNESTSLGPFTHWPNELGFDYFYGFNDDSGETDQWYPALYENHIPVNQPSYPHFNKEEGIYEDLDNSYNLTSDLADKAISWVQNNHSLSPDKPFFLYFAPGATHAPHQPPPSYTEMYGPNGKRTHDDEPNGMFTEGWDVLRANICENQEEMGIIPEGTKCTARPEEMPAWDDERFDSDDDQYRHFLAKQMQNYAGYLEYTDDQVGRMIDGINGLGKDVENNTLIIYIVGDNGGSAEGSFYGSCNQFATYNNLDYTMEDNLECQDKLGKPGTAPHYAIGWAWATDAPFRWTKQVASYFGGTRNPMVISWPDGIDAKGKLREQFLHVVDVAPTILDVVGIDPPSEVNDIWQKPMEGASFANTFESDGENATPLRDTQYFEVLAHRGIYHDGWMASSFNQAPWINDSSNLDEELQDNWELFNLDEDFSQSRDLRPEGDYHHYKCPDDLETTLKDKESDRYYSCKLQELTYLFDSEAKEHNVYPLDDRFNGRQVLERPSVLGDRTEFEFYPGSVFLPGAVAPNFAKTDYIITADLNITDPDNVQGVILANGGDTSGFSLYVNEDHHLVFEYNYFNLARTQIVSEETLSDILDENELDPLDLKVEFVFDYKDGTLPICFEPTDQTIPQDLVRDLVADLLDGLNEEEIKVDVKAIASEKIRAVGCSGTGDLYVDGHPVASGHIEKTYLATFPDSFDVGMDMRGPVSEDYADKLPFEFTGGEIQKVMINIDPSEDEMPSLESSD